MSVRLRIFYILFYGLFFGISPITFETAHAQARFDPSKSFVDQLEQLAHERGVQSIDVSKSLFDGTLTPHVDDLMQALTELDDRDCSEIYADISAYYDSPVRDNCEAHRPHTRIAQHRWNQKFGLPPENARFNYVKTMAVRSAHMEGGFPWVYHDSTEQSLRNGKHADKFSHQWDRHSTDAAPLYLSMNNANNPEANFAKIYENFRSTASAYASAPSGMSPDNISKAEARDRAMEAIESAFEPNEQEIVRAFNNDAPEQYRQVVELLDVEKRQCHLLENNPRRVLCEYRPKARIRGNNPMAGIMNKLAEIPGTFVFAVLERSNGEWILLESWDSCIKSGNEWSCRKIR